MRFICLPEDQDSFTQYLQVEHIMSILDTEDKTAIITLSDGSEITTNVTVSELLKAIRKATK